tara:strand:- start:240 stop:728 length:489 start_codon:yes stop_codon:yes gene_type:complete
VITTALVPTFPHVAAPTHALFRHQLQQNQFVRGGVAPEPPRRRIFVAIGVMPVAEAGDAICETGDALSLLDVMRKSYCVLKGGFERMLPVQISLFSRAWPAALMPESPKYVMTSIEVEVVENVAGMLLPMLLERVHAVAEFLLAQIASFSPRVSDVIVTVLA